MPEVSALYWNCTRERKPFVRALGSAIFVTPLWRIFWQGFFLWEYASCAEAWRYGESSTHGSQRGLTSRFCSIAFWISFDVPQIGMRSRCASLFVLRCRVLQSPGQHSFRNEQAQGKCWNAINLALTCIFLPLSCQYMPIQDTLSKVFVKVQMCLRAFRSTCQVEDIAQQFYIGDEVKWFRDMRNFQQCRSSGNCFESRTAEKIVPCLTLEFQMFKHVPDAQHFQTIECIEPTLANSMSRIVKGPIFITCGLEECILSNWQVACGIPCATCTLHGMHICVPWCLMQSHLTCRNFSSIDS